MQPEDFADNDPYLIIAGDSHAGLPTCLLYTSPSPRD